LYSEIDIFLLDKNHDGNSFFSRLISANRAKASLKSFFDNMKIDEIVFFHEGFCMEANWLIKYLYKTQGASVLYLPVERTFDFETKWEEDRRVKSIIKKLYCSLIWGIKVHFYKYMNSVYPVMDKNFFDSIHSCEMPITIKPVDVICDIDRKLLNPITYPHTGIVWLENTLRVFNVSWNQLSYETFLCNVFSELDTEQVFFKGHPDKALKYGKECVLSEIPSFIPGNLLVTRFSCFVGVVSDLMFEAANAGTLTISTLYLFDIKEKDREKLVDYLRKRNNNINFPKNIPEFLELLSIK